MNKLLFTLFFCVFAFVAAGQRTYFVYIQAENRQQFFVKLDEKIHSSSSSGYIILSKLRDSTYHFTIGFPDARFGEQKFSVHVNRKDRGFLLKNYGDKGWGLQDMQNAAVQMSTSAVMPRHIDIAQSGDNIDPFTFMLAKAANDATLLVKPVHALETKTEAIAKADVNKGELKNDAATIKTNNDAVTNDPASTDKTTGSQEKTDQNTAENKQNKEDTKEIAIVKKELPPDTRAQVEKKIDDPAETKSVPDVKKALPGDSLTISGSRKQEASDPKAGAEVKGTASELETVNTNQVTAEKKADTTTIQKAATNDPLLDNTLEKRPAAYQKSKVTRRSESSTTEGFGLVFIDEYADGNKDTIRILISNERPVFTTETKAEQKDDRKFLDISSESSTSAPQENKEKAVPRNDCRQVASGNDYEKLRKKMASQSTEEKMTEEAKKVFRTKCFSTEQIRSFSKLYLTNGGKYRFFDEAYPHVTDPETFSTLSGEIKDEYFLNRFKAMLLD